MITLQNLIPDFIGNVLAKFICNECVIDFTRSYC